MKTSKWLRASRLGEAIVEAIIPGAKEVERRGETIAGPLSKKDTLLALVSRGVAATEGAADRDLVDDAEIQRLAGGLIDAYIALQNGLAAKRPQ